jgi:hypothetical protein
MSSKLYGPMTWNQGLMISSQIKGNPDLDCEFKEFIPELITREEEGENKINLKIFFFGKKDNPIFIAKLDKVINELIAQ